MAMATPVESFTVNKKKKHHTKQRAKKNGKNK